MEQDTKQFNNRAAMGRCRQVMWGSEGGHGQKMIVG